MMITEHTFNSKWCGRPVGIVNNPAFFKEPAAKQKQLLSGYDWVEFKSLWDQSPAPELLLRSGFYYADTQIGFRIALQKVIATPSMEGLDIRCAQKHPFQIRPEDLRPFEHERFLSLPGMSNEKLSKRYALWSNQLIEGHEQWCLEIVEDGQVQGWFLSVMEEGKGLNLALSMLHRDASISGMLLYQKAIVSYAQLGARIGWAAFSVFNTPVLNIYSNLGARFMPGPTCWLWCADKRIKHPDLEV
jgi:hypothetical protein